MKRAVAKAAALIVAVVSMFVMLGAEKPEESPQAKAYILMEARTRAVLEEYNSDMRLNAGYLGKLMSLLVIAGDIEAGRYKLSDELTASQSVYNTKGSVVWLEPGDKMTVDDLLKSVIIGNANDAMTVLAENSSGTVDTFVMDMNAAAFDLGLRDTYFKSPYGYYDEGEYTTAHDMAVVCAELSRYESLLPAFTTWRDFVKNGRVELVSENTLTRTYDRHIGFKACHSEEAGYCAAEGGRSETGTAYVAVVLGAADEEVSLGMAKSLVKKGFTDYRVTSTMFPDEMLMPVKVKNGVDIAVELLIKEQSDITVPRGGGELRTVVVLPEYITAPVRKGQPVGTAAFYNGDSLVFETDIIAKSDVPELGLIYVFRAMLLKLIEK